MSKTFSDKAIILRRFNFGEADRILSVLTANHGKLFVKAKGVRKITAKLAGHVELLNYSELFLASGKKFYVLAGARNINVYGRVREDFDKLTIACELAELVDRNLREGVFYKDVFELFKNSLDYLNALPRHDFDQGLLKPYFIVNFLRYLGYEPQLWHCAHCHEIVSKCYFDTDERKSHVAFSYDRGGLLCEKCWQSSRDSHDSFRVSVDAIKVLRLLLAGRIEIIDRFNLETDRLREVQDVANRLLVYRLEPPARAEHFRARIVADRLKSVEI